MTRSAEEVVLAVIRDYVDGDVHQAGDAGTESLMQTRIEDLDLDSLDTLEVIMKIEENISCQLPEIEVAECETIHDLVSVCKAQMLNRTG